MTPFTCATNVEKPGFRYTVLLIFLVFTLSRNSCGLLSVNSLTVG
jgi:hypothetical protein